MARMPSPLERASVPDFAHRPANRLLGRRIALPENSELDRLGTMLEGEGATVVRFQMIVIAAAPDPTPVTAWLHALAAGAFDDVVFLSGEGVARLIAAAESAGLKTAALAALAHARKVTRGPNPARMLHELGLRAEITSTTPSVPSLIDGLRRHVLAGRRIGVQLFGDDRGNELVAFLETKGAHVHPVTPYQWAPAGDDRVASIIAELEGVDAVAFTTSIQVERLFQVARSSGTDAQLRSSLRRLHVAALGAPVVACLRRFDVRVDNGPARQFFMRRLTGTMIERLGPAAT
jgi:uroporphyrinogen-III synthase